MKQYEIKITGAGTKPHLLSALRDLIRSIDHAENIEDKTFEDPVLCTEIKSLEA